MKKNKILLASTLAILIAPNILSDISNDFDDSVQAAVTNETVLKNAVGTVDYGGAYTVDANGNQTSLYLSGKSSWKLGKSVFINGSRYFEVATNKYISATHITVTSGVPVMHTVVKPAENLVGTLTSAAKVVDINAKANGIVLPSGSAWKLGQLVNIGGYNYYQVATNEYVSAALVKNNNINNNEQLNTTITLNGVTEIVDDNGYDTSKVLPAGSRWKVDQKKTMNGLTYYRVATNQWVTNETTQNNNKNVFSNGPITVTLNKDVQLFDTLSQLYTRTLKKGTSWKVTNSAKNNKGQYFLQVSQYEWLPLTDGSIKEDGSGSIVSSLKAYAKLGYFEQDTDTSITVNLIKAQAVYSSESNSMTRSLPADTSWKITKVVRNKNNQFWGQVSTNEWLLIDASNMRMSYGDSDEVPNVAISEPEFATSITK